MEYFYTDMEKRGKGGKKWAGARRKNTAFVFCLPAWQGTTEKAFEVHDFPAVLCFL